jgi:hypothetical protein
MRALICLMLLAADCLGAPFFFGQQTAAVGGGGGSTLLTGLSLYVKFNEASGNNAADSSGNGFTLVNVNTVTYGAGKINNAASLASASLQKFTLADNNTISTGDQDFEIEVWVKLTDKATHRPIVQKGWDESYGEFLLYYNSGADRFQFQIANGAGGATVVANNFGVPSAGVFYNINVSYTASTDTLRIAVNNTFVDTATYAGGNTSTTGTFVVGLAFGAYMNGQIDDLMFWSARNLTPSERAEYYNGGIGSEP